MLVSVLILNTTTAQETVLSQAVNKTVLFGANATLNKFSNDDPLIFSRGIDKTVFINTKEIGVNNFFMSVDPPVIEFEDVVLNWSVMHQDTTLPALFESIPNITSAGNPFDIYFRESLLEGDRLYNLFTSSINLGSHFDAIDINSGQKLFRNSYNTLNDSFLEILTSIRKREDGNIELTGMRTLNVIPSLFPIGAATRRIVDKDSGVGIYDQFIPTPTSAPVTDFCWCGNSNGQYGQVFPTLESEDYLVICLEPRGDTTIFDIKKVDNLGLLKETVGKIESLLPNNGGSIIIYRYPQAFQLSNGDIAIGQISSMKPIPSSLDEALVEIIILNSNGELINRVDITELISFATWFKMDVKDDKIYITANSINDEQTKFDRSNLVILNNEGDIISSFSDLDQLDGERVASIVAAPFGDDKVLITGISIEDSNCLKFFEVDNSGSVNYLKTICHTDTIWTIIPEFTVVSDNNLIVQTSWRYYGENDEDDSFFPATFSLGFDQLGLTTSTVDIEKEGPDIYLSPNPATNSVQVNLTAQLSGRIDITDMGGRTLQSINIVNSDRVILQTQRLESGTYVVRVISDELNVSKQLLIVK
jgi:hypothetical protein